MTMPDIELKGIETPKDFGKRMYLIDKSIADELVAALKEAGDVIECYHKATGIDLGDASRMPFYRDTIDKVDTALARYHAATEGM